ncbi:MAG: cytidine deaminase [Acidobacteria bacterium]|jgi:cytidine deaminase|nr:cytidine deaminase [Acidobacteriota bacterium]
MAPANDALPRLRELAEEAATHAYAPYSKFSVGAALLWDDGVTVTGCNVENLSFGLTSCAERNAVFRRISERGAGAKIVAIAVTNPAGEMCAPCGACRQVLHEFAAPDAAITYRIPGGWATRPFAELLPDAFVMERRN